MFKMGNLDQFKIAVYIISLHSSHQRYHYSSKNMKMLKVPIKKVEAIEGSLLTKEEINKNVNLDYYLKFFGHLPSNGTIGCSFSHIKAWKEFLSSQNKFALIVEDDINFDIPELTSTLQNLLHIKSEWDIVNLAHNHHGTPLTIKNLKNGKKLALFLTEITGGAAYIINKKAAQKLLTHALPIKTPIDHYLTRIWETKTPIYGIKSKLKFQYYGDSEISRIASLDPRHSKKHKLQYNILYSSLYKPFYKLHSYILRFVSNLLVYIMHKTQSKNEKI
jgi:glycosyl transferase, family 25